MTISFYINLVLAIPPLLRYGILFLLVAMEGPLITMVAGFLGSSHLINLYLAYFVIIVADVVSDMAYFGFGWWGGRKLENKYTSITKLDSSRLHKMQSFFLRHPKKAIVIGKLTHVVGVPILVMAGISRVKFWTFVFYDTAATIPKSLFFLVVGYYFGYASDVINRDLKYGTLIVSGLTIALFAGYMLLGKYVEKKIIDEGN